MRLGSHRIAELHTCLVISAIFLLFLSPLRAGGQVGSVYAPKGHNVPVLVNTCIITGDIHRLVGFYEPVLGQKAKWSGGDYAEFETGIGALAIFSLSAQERYFPKTAESAKNRSVILEFKVADVDAEYKRLQSLVTNWVKPPTTQPWGSRSIYFRDPDGNLVDFFSLASTPQQSSLEATPGRTGHI